jgi:hypothetical protein
MEGVTARVGANSTVTGADGSWRLEELPMSSVGLTVSDDDVSAVTGDYFDYEVADPNCHNAFFESALLPVVEMESARYIDFLHFVDALTERNGVPYPSYLRHFELPINLYVPPFENNGLDFKAIIEEVATGLSAFVGFVPFNIVDSPPETGVECFFVEDLARDNYGTKEFTEDWYPVYGRIQFRTIYTPQYEPNFRIVIAHELGHAMGLNHSTDPRHLMLGGLQAPQVSMFTADEIAVLKAIYGMPRTITDGKWIRD